MSVKKVSQIKFETDEDLASTIIDLQLLLDGDSISPYIYSQPEQDDVRKIEELMEQLSK